MRKVLLADLGDFAREVLKSLDFARGKSRATLVALCGDLGAGKTTFVQALAKELGVKEIVQSPTYVLMKSYALPMNDLRSRSYSRLVHVDLYRLEKPEEFVTLKPEEFLNDSRDLVCIEWPERAGGALPSADLTIRFSSDGASESERYIEVTL